MWLNFPKPPEGLKGQKKVCGTIVGNPRQCFHFSFQFNKNERTKNQSKKSNVPILVLLVYSIGSCVSGTSEHFNTFSSDFPARPVSTV